MEYKVTITETLRLKMYVEADSKEEAYHNVRAWYLAGEIIIDSDHCIGANIEVEEA